MEHYTQASAVSSLSSTSNYSFLPRLNDIIHLVEAIVAEKKLLEMVQVFMQNYFDEDEYFDEHEFRYIALHEEYARLINDNIIEELQKKIPNYTPTDLAMTLAHLKGKLEGNCFRILQASVDYAEFEAMMLGYNANGDQPAPFPDQHRIPRLRRNRYHRAQRY